MIEYMLEVLAHDLFVSDSLAQLEFSSPEPSDDPMPDREVRVNARAFIWSYGAGEVI